MNLGDNIQTSTASRLIRGPWDQGHICHFLEAVNSVATYIFMCPLWYLPHLQPLSDTSPRRDHLSRSAVLLGRTCLPLVVESSACRICCPVEPSGLMIAGQILAFFPRKGVTFALLHLCSYTVLIGTTVENLRFGLGPQNGEKPMGPSGGHPSLQPLPALGPTRVRRPGLWHGSCGPDRSQAESLGSSWLPCVTQAANGIGLGGCPATIPPRILFRWLIEL